MTSVLSLSSAGDGTVSHVWQFRLMPTDSLASAKPALTTWMAATVPGHVHTDLLALKLIADPYHEQEEADLQWIGEASWEYRLSFDVSASALAQPRQQLVLEGIDTLASIELNGVPLCSTDNAFRTWRLNVRGLLRASANVLTVQLRAPGTSPVRKPAYHYGWEAGPRFVTAGIWRSLRLETGALVRFEPLQVQQEVSVARARLAVQCGLRCDGPANLQVQLTLLDPDGQRVHQFTRTLAADRGLHQLHCSMQIERPRRWFPNGYGEAALYTLLCQVSDEHGVLLEQRRRLGLRSVELRPGPHPQGAPMTLVINDIPVFCKGAQVVPFDLFPNRVSSAALRAMLRSAQAANMTLLRHWGGGYYECEEFYDIADELGLMVCQDFMLAGANSLASDQVGWRRNVLREAVQQVRRLREHACVVLWCGNHHAAASASDSNSVNAGDSAGASIASVAPHGYETLLRKLVARHGGGLSYLCATPDFLPPLAIQSWPVAATIDSVITRAHQQIAAPEVRAHQKWLAGAGNERLLHEIRAHYREPVSFADFVYLSQVMQAETVECAAIAQRAVMPRNMGVLVSQLNDVWPGASCSSVDYYGRWKALHFHARRFFAPEIVAASRADGMTRVTLVSDRARAQIGELRVRVLDMRGLCLRDSRERHMMAATSAVSVANYSDEELLGALNPCRHVAVFELSLDGEPVARSVVYFAPARQLDLPTPSVQAVFEECGDYVQLSLTSSALARAVWISFDGLDVEVSDNALTLLPGERRLLRVDGAGIADLRRCLHLRHLGVAQP